MGTGTSTHVANDYTHPIRVKCDAERRHYTEVDANAGFNVPKLGINAQGHFKGDINKLTTGFTRIMPGKAVRFDVDCRGTNTVYITIFAEDGNHSAICDGMPKQEDYSVMVTKDRQVVDVKYGSVWEPKSDYMR